MVLKKVDWKAVMKAPPYVQMTGQMLVGRRADLTVWKRVEPMAEQSVELTVVMKAGQMERKPVVPMVVPRVVLKDTR